MSFAIRDVMAELKNNSDLKKKPRVAFQGERGAFSEEAAVKLLGEQIELVPRPTFEAMFAAVEEGAADLVLAPVENSLSGSVYRCYDLLLHSKLNILAEVVLPVVHNLIGPPGATFERVRVVQSHPVALGQCTRFFVHASGDQAGCRGGYRGERGRSGARGRRFARGDCQPARGGNLWRHDFAGAPGRPSGELHALLAAGGRAARACRSRQDVPGDFSAAPAGRSVQGAGADRAAGNSIW